MRWFSPVTLGAATLIIFAEARLTSSDSADQPTVFAPHGNPWKVLSDDETAGVNALLQQAMSLTGNQGSSQDSYIVQLSLLLPNKTDVVPYLDSNATAPDRYARATVQLGATNSTDMYWQEYMVGPLPTTNSTHVEPLTYFFNNAQPGRTPVQPIYSPNDAVQFQLKFGSEIEDITKQLWNSTFAEGTIGVRFGVPFWEENNRIISWASFFAVPRSNISSPTLLALGAAARVDITSRNWEDWAATGWYSLGKFYDSTEDLRTAINASDYVKPQPNVDGNWTSTDMHGDPLPLDELTPPISVAQGSQRFQIDVNEGYVQWMDFSFYHSISHDVGLSLFDIQYQGKRIIYELSLQEALTVYAGSDPFSSQATFFDSVTGMGSTLQPLVRGYDCPSHATYLNSTWIEGNSTKTVPDGICVFEFDAGFPIRRHSFSPSAPVTSVAKNIMLTMRTIATVGNYDFMIEYSFFYDGAIEISARASGYISATYWENAPEYGFHIHDYLSGSLHDHILNFKADFDILGTKNSVQKVDIVPTSTTYPWSGGRVHNTFKATRSFMQNESEAGVYWGDNDAINYAIVNRDTPNRFGEYPGYRIKRNAGTIHLTALNSSDILNAGAYGTHDLFITQQHDTEPRSADAYNQFNPADPLVDFSAFLDEESLEQEDLVLWFNLGMHHMPHTGDLPNTMFTAAHSAIRFEPLNYLEGDPSVASKQQVRILYDDEGSVESVEEFGKIVANGTCG